jgi:hypothetical protein
MESLREIVKRSLLELKSREDAHYFFHTITALEIIEAKLEEDPIENLIKRNLLIWRCLRSLNTAGALSKNDSPFDKVAADGNRRAPEYNTNEIKASDLDN